jgi:hypothetical protein
LDAWALTGSVGTDPLVNFLGTADEQPLEIRVNSNLALRIEDSPSGPLIGIGTAPPQATLHVGGKAIVEGDLELEGTVGFGSSTEPMMYIYPSGVSNPDRPVVAQSPGYPGLGMWYEDTADRFTFKSAAAAVPSMVIDVDSQWVTINTATPKPGYELSVNGQIVCEELLVQSSLDWPDYVFADDYPLRSLAEVESHIKTQRRLPGIPSAADLEQEGLSIGTMQKRMMEKIEELTLYTIEQDKQLAEQAARIRKLEALFSQGGKP